MAEKLTRKDVNKCSKCGTLLNESAQFCPNCGQKVGQRQNKKNNQDFEKYKPNKERLIKLKQFLQNNFELSHTIYGLIFLFTLFSKWLGFLSLIIATIVLYMMAVSNKGKPIKANQQLRQFYSKVTQRFQDTVQEANSKRKEGEDKDSFVDREFKRDDTMNNKSSKKEAVHKKYKTYYQKKNYIKKSSSGFSSFFLFMSSIVTLYGVLASGFISSSNASLYNLVGQTSFYIRRIEGISRFFGSSSGSSADFIQFMGYGLILFPILTIVFSCFTRLKILRFLGFIASLMEAGIFGFIIYYISDRANQLLGSYSGSVLETGARMFGTTAKVFVIATVLMIIFAGYRLFQKRR